MLIHSYKYNIDTKMCISTNQMDKAYRNKITIPCNAIFKIHLSATTTTACSFVQYGSGLYTSIMGFRPQWAP